MEPPSEVVRACVTIGHCFAVAGLYTEAVAGQPSDPLPSAVALTSLIDLPLNTHTAVFAASRTEDFDAVLLAWTVPVPPVEEGQAPGVRPASFGEKGRARLAFQYAKDHVALIKQDWLSSTQQSANEPILRLAQEVAALAQRVTAPSAPVVATPTVPLKEIVSQISDTSAPRLSKHDVLGAYQRYATVLGAGQEPHEDEEPTEDQLSAFKHLIDSGEVPYCDFAVWGPHGHRLVRRQRLTGQVLNHKGEFSTIELVGPSTYHMWKACWSVLQNALLMVGAVDLGYLLAYAKLHDNFYQRHGDKTWALQYQADVRARLEHFVRLYRTALADYQEAVRVNSGTVPANYPFDPQRPWNHIFAKLVADTRWWDKQ